MWFMAQCIDCGGGAQPFRKYDDRADWVGAHRVATGHRVYQWIEGGGE